MSKETKILFSLILIALGVVCRLLPHLWNFTPMVAIALFAGVYLGKNYALSLPLITTIISDYFLGFYEWQIMLAVYSSYFLIGLLSIFIKRYKNWETIIATSITASVLFFLITNWAVWQFSSWYSKDWNGLIDSYVLALPFFRNSLLGDLFYTLTLFGCCELVIILLKTKKTTDVVVY